MKNTDHFRLHLLRRALKEWSSAMICGDTIQSTSVMNQNMERKAFEGVSILLEMQSLGDTLWITAEFDGATLMMPVEVAPQNDVMGEWVPETNFSETVTLSVN